MRKHPGRFSLLLVLAALAMLAMPMSVGAAPSKKAAVTAKTPKVNKARSDAAKKGWETRRMKQKAESNWASRNPKGGKPEAKEAFIKKSVASQRAWQKRKAATTKASPKKVKKVVVAKKVKKAAGKKAVAAAPEAAAARTKVAKGKKSEAPATAEDAIQASVGAADFKTGLAKFDEARFALSENRNMDAAVAQMDGHDAMAQSAYDTADAYEAAGRTDEAKNLRAFADDHLAKADALEKAIGEQQARTKRGPVSRFFSWINPFKKRGGNAEPQVVAGG